MQVFANYASYYDLLYQDKDYAGEVNYVHNLIQSYRSGAETVLELGCGTGMHASLLAEKGYTVCGIDLSAEMLEAAQQRLLTLPEKQASKLKFIQGDAQTVRVDQQFDVVISLFHVVSYQPTNEALRAAFETAKTHLKPGGIFLFDCWYGPAVLSDPPTVRVKRLENEKIRITRIAEPVLHPNQNTVDVNYQVLIRDLTTGVVEELQERHTLRYLFKPEVDLLFEQHGFSCLAIGEWMTDQGAGSHTWNVYFIGQNQPA
ncbi:MAG: class I SAM-dependent methyltransferase [Verrucomicrobia bacterium]|nr:class I SAM-dependent methyltransferase [Leptolyngbya sp. ES-bin-22]